MGDIIQNKPVSTPHTTNMLDTNVNVNDDSQYFATPRKHNQIDTEQIYQVLLGSDLPKCKQNIKTHMTRQKIPPSVKEYLCCKTYRRTSRYAKCTKSREFTKVIETIISIE